VIKNRETPDKNKYCQPLGISIYYTSVKMRRKNIFYFNFSTADHIGVGFFKYQLFPSPRFLVINSAFANMLGYLSKREVKKENFSSLFVHQEDKDNFFNALQKEGRVKFFETIFKKKNRKKFWVAITASYLLGKNSSRYIEGIIEDISSHKEAEERLALERDFLQGLLDNIPDAVYFKDTCNRIIRVNKFYAQGVGLKPEEIIGKTDFDFFPYHQAKQMLEDDNYVLRTGKPIVGKIERTLLPDGSWNQVITTKIPMYDRKGKIIGTMGITRDMTAYANTEREKFSMVMNALEVLNRALEMRDPYTSGHSQRVAYLAECIAKELGWSEERILAVKLAGELHDVGKIVIPLDILTKPGRLTELEYKIIQDHVEKCYQLLKDVNFPFPLAKIIYQHHERLDGSGYPNHLKEEEILPEARILAISDVLEAVTSRRPYREALGLERAIEELKAGAGSKYDEKLVKIVFNLIERYEHKPFWMNA